MSTRSRSHPWFRDSPRPLPPMTESENDWRLQQLGQAPALDDDFGGFYVLRGSELRMLGRSWVVIDPMFKLAGDESPLGKAAGKQRGAIPQPSPAGAHARKARS